MSDFQEQAKNWLRNVVKQNPDKIKSGVEKAGDLVDKHTGGKYADKVDAAQQKVGDYVDGQAPDGSQPTETADAGGVPAPGGGVDPETTGEASDPSPDVVGGDAPDPSSEPSSSAGSTPEGTETGATVTGQADATPKPGPPRS